MLIKPQGRLHANCDHNNHYTTDMIYVNCSLREDYVRKPIKSTIIVTKQKKNKL